MVDREHLKHRQRMKARYTRYGYGAFDEIEKLEFLLFFCLPYKDTRPIAKALLDRYGTFWDLLNATPRDLCKVPGVGENTALFFGTLRQFFTCLLDREDVPRLNVNDRLSFETYLMRRFDHKDREQILLVPLDGKLNVLCADVIAEGTLCRVPVSLRTVVDYALSKNAVGLVFAHNHPSGFCRPSEDDDRLTESLLRILTPMEITLVDHMIFAEDRLYSYRREGRLEALSRKSLLPLSPMFQPSGRKK